MPDIMQGLMAMLAQAGGGQGPSAPDVGNAAPQGMPDWLSKRPTTMPDQPAGPATSFNVDSVSSLLRGYGIQFPEHLDDRGPVEKGWLGRGHPGLARGLDNALIAVGSMGPSSLSAGDNISNAVRGVLNIQPYRVGLQQEQLKIPLEMTKAVGEMQMHQAMMNMYLGRGDYYRDAGLARLQQEQVAATNAETNRQNVNQKMQIALMNDQMKGAGHYHVGIGPDGKKAVFAPHIDEQGNLTQELQPGLDPFDLTRQSRAQGSDIYKAFTAIHGPEPNPETNPKEAAEWGKGFLLTQFQKASVGPMISGKNQQNLKTYGDALDDIKKSEKDYSYKPWSEADKNAEIKSQRRKLVTQGQDPATADAMARQAVDAEEQKRMEYNTKLNEHTQEFRMQSRSPEDLEKSSYENFLRQKGIQFQSGGGSLGSTGAPAAQGGPGAMNPNVQAIIGALQK